MPTVLINLKQKEWDDRVERLFVKSEIRVVDEEGSPKQKQKRENLLRLVFLMCRAETEPEQLAIQKQEMKSQNLLLIQQQQESNVMFEHFLHESALECFNMPFLCFAPSYGPSTISISPFGVTTDRNLIAWVFLCWL